jgi:hypothetical protein
VRLAAREAVLRTVKLLRSEVCSASVWAHFTSLLCSKYFTIATAITSLSRQGKYHLWAFSSCL